MEEQNCVPSFWLQKQILSLWSTHSFRDNIWDKPCQKNRAKPLHPAPALPSANSGSSRY